VKAASTIIAAGVRNHVFNAFNDLRLDLQRLLKNVGFFGVIVRRGQVRRTSRFLRRLPWRSKTRWLRSPRFRLSSQSSFPLSIVDCSETDVNGFTSLPFPFSTRTCKSATLQVRHMSSFPSSAVLSVSLSETCIVSFFMGAFNGRCLSAFSLRISVIIAVIKSPRLLRFFIYVFFMSLWPWGMWILLGSISSA